MKAPEKLFHTLLGLGGEWEITELEFAEEVGEMQICIEATAGLLAKEACPKDGGEVSRYDSREREWRHLDVFEHKCYIRSPLPRMRCKTCGHVYQVHAPWEGLSKHFTASFEAMALLLMREMPVKKVAEYVREHDTRLWRIMQKHVALYYGKLNFSDVTQIGVDETSSRKSHKYITIFADMKKRRVLYATPERNAETFDRFAEELKKHEGDADNIECVSMDMSAHYKAGARNNCPNAEVVFDKYHLIAMANEGVNRVRRTEMKRRWCATETMKGTRWLWLTNPENLTEKQAARLERIDKTNIATAKAYQMRLSLQDAYMLPHYHLAKRRLLAWCRWVRRQAALSKYDLLKPMLRVAKAIERNLPGILKHWESRVTNAYMEGINSLFQMVKRRARGYRSDERFISMMYFVAGKLQSPVSL